MRRSRKQQNREVLTVAMVRHRAATKQAKADRALYVAIGGTVEWQRELCRRRAARNARCRARTAAVVAAKRAASATEPQPGLWAA